MKIVSILAKVSDLNAPNSFGSSPLHDAVFQGKIEVFISILFSLFLSSLPTFVIMTYYSLQKCC